MHDKIAVVIGGSQSVWAELDKAQELLREVEVKPLYIACNDMIDNFSKECVCITLHADKLPGWLASRTAKGMSIPRDVWVCTKERNKGGAIFASHYMDDLGGSVGLFACRVAISHYGCKVILCGVPMTQQGNHFVRQKPWKDVKTFEHRWRPHIGGLLQGKVRSYSGKTKEWFGEPDLNFIQQNMEAK